MGICIHVSYSRLACGKANTNSITFESRLCILENFEDEEYSEHIDHWIICFPVAVNPLLHANIDTYTSFMLQQLSIRFSFSFERLDGFYWS